MNGQIKLVISHPDYNKIISKVMKKLSTTKCIIDHSYQTRIEGELVQVISYHKGAQFPTTI